MLSLSAIVSIKDMDPTVYNQPPAAPPTMAKHKSKHTAPIWVAIVLGVLLVIAVGSFVWAFMGYNTYKNDAQSKIDIAVEEAKKVQAEDLEKGFQSQRDRLFNTYKSDPSLANIQIQYPRDWSLYLEQSTSSKTQIDAIFHPTVVEKKDPSSYALRLQLFQELYNEVVDDYQNAIENGEIKAQPITSNGVNGIRLEGAIDKDHSNAALVIFPIRDKTLVITTESRDHLTVFNDAIAKLIFTP